MDQPLLLLPGMMCDARLFVPQLTEFSKTRPVTVAPMTFAASMEELAKGILASAPPKFALAGLSMGGILAMEMVRLAPQRITHLALLDTNPLAETKDRRALRDEQITRAKNGELRTIIRNEMKPHYLAPGPNRQPILDVCMSMATDLGADVFIQQSLALRDRIDQQHTLRGVSVPSLVLCGASDHLCPVSRHELMQQIIPQASLVVVEDAGHLPTLEQPAVVNSAFQHWLAQ